MLYDDRTHVDTPYSSRVKFTDRAYPIYTAGTIKSLSYEPDSGAFRLQARSKRVKPGDQARATVVYIPAGDQGRLEASGATLATVAAPSGARKAFAYPRGGAHEVTVAG